MSDPTVEIAKLRSDLAFQQERIANLEVAIQAMWVMLRDIQPPDVQDGCNEMMRELFENNTALGGYRRMNFECYVTSDEEKP